MNRQSFDVHTLAGLTHLITAADALKDKMWMDDGPKTGYGSIPGFEVKSGELEARVKFAETASEPFTARVFAALGCHVGSSCIWKNSSAAATRRFAIWVWRAK